jgi:hypothetical protein
VESSENLLRYKNKGMINVSVTLGYSIKKENGGFSEKGEGIFRELTGQGVQANVFFYSAKNIVKFREKI